MKKILLVFSFLLLFLSGCSSIKIGYKIPNTTSSSITCDKSSTTSDLISSTNNSTTSTSTTSNTTSTLETSFSTITTISSETNIKTTKEDNIMVLLIDNKKVEIEWEDNNSVSDLYELAKNELIINMQQSGGFEQYGPIGKTISSSDKSINANYGDVILYSSRYLCIMYGSNTWNYTKVGHINLSQAEIKELLDKSSVVVTLKLK